MRKIPFFTCVFMLMAACTFVMAGRAAASSARGDLLEMSLEQLLDLKVVSVDKNLKSLENTPAAVYVLSRDDIRASGAQTIADALRLVPGLHVGQVTSTSWAVGARGLNGTFNNKFLMLIDGRSAFNPLYNGVDWSTADVPLEQIERIEIIRGPGGTLWETKAMNGVVNIITRDSSDTLGTVLEGAAGTGHRAGALIQHGAKVGEGMTLRAWGKYDDWDGLALPDGDSADDGYEQSRGGFRLDWQAADNKAFTLSGDIFKQDTEDRVPVVDLTAPGFRRDDTSGEDRNGGYLLGHWDWNRGEGETVSLQAYYSRNSAEAALLDFSIDTFDAELNHHLPLGTRNKFGWGLGFRYLHDDTESKNNVRYAPSDYDFKAYSAYLQDEFAAIPDKLTLTIGVKAEHNSFTGWEVQPSARFLWKIVPGHSVWGAVSRAVRTPSRSDVAIDVDAAAFPGPYGVPVVVNAVGNPDVDAEKVVSWEAGYRTSPNYWSSLDIAVFYSRYDDLIGSVPGAIVPSLPPLIMPVTLQNSLDGHSTGIEIALRVEPTDWWRVNLNYTWLNVNLDSKIDGASTAQELSSPEHQANLLSSFRLGEKWHLGAVLRYVGEVEQFDVPAYLEGDLNLSWLPTENLEVSIAGRNLFDAQHPEYPKAAFAEAPLEVERSALVRVLWKF